MIRYHKGGRHRELDQTDTNDVIIWPWPLGLGWISSSDTIHEYSTATLSDSKKPNGIIIFALGILQEAVILPHVERFEHVFF